MKQIEVSAKSTEEAIEKGLQQLGCSMSDVDVQVLEEGSKGLFGLFGSRQAKVRLTVKEDDDPLANLVYETAAKVAAKAEASAPKTAPAAPKAEKSAAPKAEKPAAPKAEKSAAPKAEKPAAPKAEKPAAPKAEKPVAPKAEKPVAPKAEKPEAAEDEEAAVKPAPAQVQLMEKPEVSMIPEDQLTEDSPAGQAYAFVKQMTHLMGVDVSIEMGTDPEGNVFAYMNGDTLGILIGRRGETLDALQYLTSLKVNRGREGYVRVTLDTEGYRARREETLIRLANRMANRAVKTGRKVGLEPMNPYERRIIHFALQQDPRVDTHSEGEEPNRRVVITLNK